MIIIYNRIRSKTFVTIIWVQKFEFMPGMLTIYSILYIKSIAVMYREIKIKLCMMYKTYDRVFKKLLKLNTNFTLIQ